MVVGLAIKYYLCSERSLTYNCHNSISQFKKRLSLTCNKRCFAIESIERVVLQSLIQVIVQIVPAQFFLELLHPGIFIDQ